VLPDQAIQARADAFPNTRFIAITDSGKASTTNLTLLPDGTPGAISKNIDKALLADTSAYPSS